MTEAEKRIRAALVWRELHDTMVLDAADVVALLADRDEREAKLRAEVEALRAERDALAKQDEAFRHLVDACKLLASEAEEYEFDDGMGRGALLDYWYEFDRKIDAAIDAQIEKEKANGSR